MTTFTFYNHQGTAATVRLVVDEEYDAASQTYRIQDAYGVSYGFPAQSVFYYTREEEEDATEEPAQELPTEDKAQGVYTPGLESLRRCVFDGEEGVSAGGSGGEVGGVPGDES